MLSWQQVHAAVNPLRFIFWGGILWIFDLTFTYTINGTGFRLDILDDTVGTLLITFGIFHLASAPVGGRYRTAMTFVKAVALLSVVETVIKHFVFEYPAPLTFFIGVLAVCQLAATVVFCMAMKRFCEEAALADVARSWRITLILFWLIYALPLGIFYLASLGAMAAGTSFSLNLGIGGLLLLPVFAVPLVHLFVSTSRMRRAAEKGIAGEAPEAAIPG